MNDYKIENIVFRYISLTKNRTGVNCDIVISLNQLNYLSL